MSLREIGNTSLHILGGAAFACAILACEWAIIPAVLIFGLLREQAQHRDQGWFGWITGHRLWEACQWGVGAAVATGLWIWIRSSIEDLT